MIPEYRYRCTDQAVLLEPFKRFVIRPVSHVLPRGIPANFLTVAANLFLFLALYRAFVRSPEDSIDFLITPLCLFLYVLGDHLDGLQAQRSGIVTPLGEFCDHGLDTINTGILVFILLRLYAIETPCVAAFAFSSAYLAHATIFHEQYRTGRLIFERISSLEGVFLAMGVILAGAIPPVRQALTQPVWAGLSPAAFLLLGSAIGSLGTWVRSVRRLGTVSLRYGVYCGAMVLIALFSACFFSRTAMFLLITAYGAHYTLGSMRGHLVDGREHGPDLLLPLAVVGLLLCRAAGRDGAAMALPFMVAWLGCLLIERAVRIALPLRRFWVWRNPPEVRPS